MGAKKKSTAKKKSKVQTSGVVRKASASKTSTGARPTSPDTTATARSWRLADIRRAWIEYFEGQKHLHLPSAGLIPAGDPTLLFTTAGMVQFKPYFAGAETPPSRRAITIQKCLRTTDLENVGKTARHLTFFEMLGNFSFGDYFKREAIRMAWDFSLNWLKLDAERIHVTVFESDDEAVQIWREEAGLPAERITRLGKSDNWWGPAGDSGACGPCSELYLDRGAQICEHCTCSDKSKCAPGGEGDRYMEYWNLVFNQFHQDAAGKLHPLPMTGIDTGAGLERMAALLNDLDSVFDTDEMALVMKRIEELSAELRADGQRIAYSAKTREPFRVLADHARAASFCIADGIYPGNTGRGYVIRRIIRRALLFARELGIFAPILHRLSGELAQIYGAFYPELKERAAEIERRLRSEEERFLRTLEHGLGKWDEYLKERRASNSPLFSGDRAFTLYDTFGFPLEMTIELAARAGLTVDLERFEMRMEEQRLRASQAARFKDFTLPSDLPVRAEQATAFVGYDLDAAQSTVLAVLQGETTVASLQEGQNGIVILDRTPFYAEGGGQLGDRGQLSGTDGALFEVSDTQKVGGFYLHIGEMKAGTLQPGFVVEAAIERERRDALMRHHSATHLLNQVLRQKLGDHIVQTGSLVSPDYLRFDFSHSERIEPARLQEIEAAVNEAIAGAAAVQAEVLPIEEARKKGAVATFGEKYGSQVRIVSMGARGDLSLEFCGGCHVRNTGDIGFFHILREASPGAGNRRIEALAGEKALQFFQDEIIECNAQTQAHNARLQLHASELGIDAGSSEWQSLVVTARLPATASAALKSAADVAPLARRIEETRAQLAEADRRLNKILRERKQAQSGQLLEQVDSALEHSMPAGACRILSHFAGETDAETLRKFGDRAKEKARGIIVLLGARTEKGPLLLFMADRAAVEAGADMSLAVRQAAAHIGGGGGGKPEMAQAGGKNAEALPAALQAAVALVAKQLGSATRSA